MTIKNNEFEPALGIDLGTTYSLIARWEGRGPIVYQLQSGEKSLPSVIYYDQKNDKFIFGKTAKRRGAEDPQNLAKEFKRDMDKDSDSLKRGDNKDFYSLKKGGKELTPTYLSAEILKHLYKDVKAQLGDHNGQKFQARATIVTVPYCFKADQCERTQNAAKEAGINFYGTLQEPVAASLTYGLAQFRKYPDGQNSENVLVFDLGGGTFDLALLKLEQNKKELLFRGLAVGGDDHLGGIDFDNCLVKLILKKSGIKLDGLSEIEHKKSKQKLLEAAVDTKHQLSSEKSSLIIIPDVIPGTHIEDLEITRKEFEESIKDYTKKIEEIIDSLLGKANFTTNQVDRIVLAGGSSRIPCMKDLLIEKFGREKISSFSAMDPDLCVAEGAAIYAAYLYDTTNFECDIKIIGVTCHTLGVGLKDQIFDRIIEENTVTPVKRTKIYRAEETRMNFDVPIYQGNSFLVSSNVLIGEVHIPEKTEIGTPVEIEFTVTEEQILSAEVRVNGNTYGGAFEIRV